MVAIWYFDHDKRGWWAKAIKSLFSGATVVDEEPDVRDPPLPEGAVLFFHGDQEYFEHWIEAGSVSHSFVRIHSDGTTKASAEQKPDGPWVVEWHGRPEHFNEDNHYVEAVFLRSTTPNWTAYTAMLDDASHLRAIALLLAGLHTGAVSGVDEQIRQISAVALQHPLANLEGSTSVKDPLHLALSEFSSNTTFPMERLESVLDMLRIRLGV